MGRSPQGDMNPFFATFYYFAAKVGRILGLFPLTVRISGDSLSNNFWENEIVDVKGYSLEV